MYPLKKVRGCVYFWDKNGNVCVWGGGGGVNCNIKLNTMPRAWTPGHPPK